MPENESEQASLRVAFACFIGFAVLAMADVMREHGRRSPTFWTIGVILAIVALCAIASYFRPRGIAFFITNTAYFGLFVFAGLAFAGSVLARLAGAWGGILAAVLFIFWIAVGIWRTRGANVDRARREADGRGR